MKIASSALQMESSHARQQHHEIRESLRAWVGNRRPDFDNDNRRPVNSHGPVNISEAGMKAQASEANAIEQGLDNAEKDPVLSMIRALVSMLTGREIKIFDASTLKTDAMEVPAAPPTPSEDTTPRRQNVGHGVEYDRHESYTEIEQTTFNASGSIRTTDGQEINFELSLSMARHYHEESDVSIRLGDARQKKDPLVINFGGTAAQLTSQRFKFDLDSDGKSEQINFATGGSGFLALDRNGDGKINDGGELFGARSGDGFAELAALDGDENGWIDENDAAFDRLRILSKDDDGRDRLYTLRDANVGALSVSRIATPFDLKDSNNSLLGEIRSSGVFLQEDGKAGTMQQIDLTV